MLGITSKPIRSLKKFFYDSLKIIPASGEHYSIKIQPQPVSGMLTGNSLPFIQTVRQASGTEPRFRNLRGSLEQPERIPLGTTSRPRDVQTEAYVQTFVDCSVDLNDISLWFAKTSVVAN